MPAPDGGGDVVVAESVSYRYPNAPEMALRDLSLRVRRGEFLAIVGPTGAGKSTFCLALNGIVPHFYGGEFYGRVEVDGRDTVEHPTHALARGVGMVLEDPEMQLTAPSVLAEVAFALENLSTPPDEIRARASEVLRAVRLEGLEAKHPAQLSGGQKQRLAIASALALRPAVLVLDEPTSQLDPAGAAAVMDLLREFNRERGVTVVLVSHAAEEVAEHADRVVLLAAGAVVAEGPPSRIYREVELLRRHDLRPPQVAEAFHLLGGGLAAAPVPTTLAGALALRPRLAARPAPPDPAPPAAGGEVLLEAEGLGHAYPDGTVALRDVSVRVRRGEYVAIVGQNGGGKTTLVRHFLRLLEPTSGRVRVMGRDLKEYQVSELARRIGYVAQNPDHQIFASTVAREVSFALEHQKMPKAEVRARTEAALASMRLGWAADRHPLSLSKGDRSRIVVAAIVAMEPEVLVFDEPTTGQDHKGALALMDLTRELHAAGRTVVVVTHHLHLLPGYAERALVMGGGRLLLDAPLRDAFHAEEVLRATSIEPPQAVRLARGLAGGGAFRPLTPAELAAGLAWREAA